MDEFRQYLMIMLGTFVLGGALTVCVITALRVGRDIWLLWH